MRSPRRLRGARLGRHINDHRDAWEVVRRTDHPNVGLILDSFHTLARRLDVSTIRAIPGDRIFLVQLADAPRIDMDLLYWSRHFRNMPGQGDLAVLDFMRSVSATGYAGPLPWKYSTISSAADRRNPSQSTADVPSSTSWTK